MGGEKCSWPEPTTENRALRNAPQSRFCAKLKLKVKFLGCFAALLLYTETAPGFQRGKSFQTQTAGDKSLQTAAQETSRRHWSTGPREEGGGRPWRQRMRLW